MAIGIHIAHVSPGIEQVDGIDTFVERVKDESDDVPNTDSSPTVDEYLALEAADDYLPCIRTDKEIVTVSAADINGA